MNNPDNLLGVLSTIVRNRKFLLRLALVVGLGTAAVAFLLPDYFASTATFYPASPELANPELMFGNTGQVAQSYGSETDLDRMLTIAESNELLDFMIKKFGLYVHYDIDSTKKKAPFKVRERLLELYKVEKTKADAVELTVEDTDPKFAAAMVNAAMAKIDEIASRLTHEQLGKQLLSFEESMTDKKLLLKNYTDSILLLRRQFGIIDVGSQGELLTEMVGKAESEVTRGRVKLDELSKDPNIPRDTLTYIKANLKASEKEYFDLTDPKSVKSMNLNRYNEGYSKFSELADLHYQARKQLSFDIERYNHIKAVFKTNIPSTYVIQTGEVPVVKSRPMRSILILAAVFATVVFGILGLLLAENYRDVKWSEISGR